MADINMNETLNEFAGRLMLADDNVSMRIEYVPGNGFVVFITDYNSMSFSASGYGASLQEALARMDAEIAIEEELPEMPEWAVYALSRLR